ncbi:hypothetical protein BJV82DRAFT_614256 [Fennellomyces sp. T-0311]|nr:hypothetical protein BJV82DRAFT_614256 [Fennellomyces sp. T-0311]
MPPNSTIEPYSSSAVALIDHFWTCDRQGMDRLVSTIRHAYDTLDDILTVYGQRAVLEREFGQKLIKLNNPTTTKDETTASRKAVATIYHELARSAQSHIDMATRLEEQVAGPLKEWITEHRHALAKIMDGLEKTYNERQDRIFQFLQIREQSGRSGSNEHDMAVKAADTAVREWNNAWKTACQQIQMLEHERMDMFTTNLWDYANLASARLMVQDEWCENIRKQLEACTIEEELAHHVETNSAGSSVPTTSDYVEFFAREYKEKMMNKKLPPRPRTMSNQLVKPDQVASSSGSMMVRRKPLTSTDLNLDALLKKFEMSASRKVDPRSVTELPKPPTERPVELPPARPPMELPKKPALSRSPPVELPSKETARPMSTADLPKRSIPAELPPKPAPSESDPPARPLMPIDRIPNQQPPKSPRPQAAQPPKSPRPQSRPPPMKVSTSQLPSNMPPRSPVMTPHSAVPLSQATPHSPAIPIHSPIMPPPSSVAVSHSPAMTHQQPMMMAPHSPAMVPHSPAMIPPPHSPAMMVHSPMISHSPNMAPAPHSYYQASPSPVPPSTWSPASSPYYYRQANSVMQAPPYADDHQQMHLPDGTPIMFWVRAKYDYSAQDETEVSFNRASLLAVTGESPDLNWWNAILWDETWHRPLGAGCIPDNYVERIS